MFYFLIKLSVILCLVNARTVQENAKTQLPVDEKQIDFLAASVCTDLMLALKNMVSVLIIELFLVITYFSYLISR